MALRDVRLGSRFCGETSGPGAGRTRFCGQVAGFLDPAFHFGTITIRQPALEAHDDCGLHLDTNSDGTWQHLAVGRYQLQVGHGDSASVSESLA